MNQFFSCLFAEILFQNQGVLWRYWPLSYRGRYYSKRSDFWKYYFDSNGQLIEITETLEEQIQRKMDEERENNPDFDPLNFTCR